MAKCTGCGNELAANARFCPLCGTQSGQATPPNPSGAALRPPNTTMPPGSIPPSSMPARPPQYAAAPPYEPESGAGKGKVYAAAGAGIVVVLIAALIFAKASGLLSANKTQAPPAAVLNAPVAQTAPAPVMNAPRVDAPKVTAPVLTPPQALGNPMPDDVVAYLRWLKQFEEARRRLKAQGDADFMMILTKVGVGGEALNELFKEPDQQKDNLSVLSKEDYAKINGNIKEWNDAAGLFQQKPPPNPCASLAGSYYNMLGTTTSQLVTLRGVLDNIQRMSQGDKSVNVSTIMTQLSAQNNGKGMSHSADATFVGANAALDQLRDRYTSMPPDIDKAHFDIEDQSQVSVPAVSIPGAGM